MGTTITVDSDNEANGGVADFMGTDFADFQLVAGSGAASVTLGVGAAGFADFIGTGTLDLVVIDTRSWATGGAGDGVTQVTNSQTIADYEVVYVFEAIPEPSSAILLGLAASGFVGLRGR